METVRLDTYGAHIARWISHAAHRRNTRSRQCLAQQRHPTRALSGGSRLAGFRIEGAGGVAADDDVVLEDLEVAGAALAVTFGRGSRGTLRGSYIHDNFGVAVHVAPAGFAKLLNNVITDNAMGMSFTSSLGVEQLACPVDAPAGLRGLVRQASRSRVPPAETGHVTVRRSRRALGKCR